MSQKRPETDDTAGEISLKRLRTSLISDDDDNADEVSKKCSSEESSVVEIMKSLEAELNYPRNHLMKYSRSLSSSSLSSSSFCIINGCDGESCGPSFSDSTSSVMASLDMSSCSSYLVGPTLNEISGEDSSSSSSSPQFGFTGGEGNENEINGCDEEVEENEDEWLERVLYRTPIEEEFLSLCEEEEEERSDLSF